MKKLLRLFLISLILIGIIGCGSQSKNKTLPGEPELEGISNTDFKWPDPIDYSPVDDFLNDDISYKKDVLKNETFAKAPRDKIVSISAADNDIDKAIIACYRKEFKKADLIFDKLYKKYRSNPIYWNQIGNCFFLKNESKKALLYFNKAREIKKDYIPAINNVGVVLDNDGSKQKALKAYQEARSKSKFSLTPLFNLAQLYTRYGLLSEGKKFFSSFVKLNPSDQHALYALGYLNLASGNKFRAIELFNELSGDFIKKPEVAVNYAYALCLVNKKSKARDLLDDMRSTNNNELLDYARKIRGLTK